MIHYNNKYYKQIPDFPHYFISDEGEVFSIRYKHGHESEGLFGIMRTSKKRNGYIGIILTKHKEKKEVNKLIHRLVYEAWKGTIPQNKNINHINGIKDDNRLENLEVITQQENIQHAYRAGLTRAQGGHAVFTYKQAEQIREEYWNTKITKIELAKKNKVVLSTICRIINNETYTKEVYTDG